MPFFPPLHESRAHCTAALALGMPDLPPGWSFSNSEGSHAAPPPRPQEDLEDSDEDLELAVDIQPDSPGWEDVEPGNDIETTSYKCLICPENFDDAGKMLDHCRSEHSFDFLEIRRLHALDFYSTIKLVNYIRSAVADGKPPDVPDLADPAVWADDRFMKPVLEDDALLYSLDEVVDFGGDGPVQDVVSG
ncbi:hypothetical protein BDY17DRAFT_303309, partial [Neohortaea acidophila]